MQPIVLLTCDHIPGESGIVYHRLFRTYTDALIRTGAFPLIVPACPDDAVLQTLANTADGLLLTGGCDVSPSLYGEKTSPSCGPVDSERDEIESALLTAFIRRKKPVLGICRGAQLINCALGGTLHQDLPGECGVNHSGVSHEIVCTPDSFLAQLFGERFITNSTHHQSVKTSGENIEIIARCGDIVEGFRHRQLPIFATQFHPERMQGDYQLTPGAPDMSKLFDFFVKQL